MKVQQITQSDIARSENRIECTWNYRINSWRWECWHCHPLRNSRYATRGAQWRQPYQHKEGKWLWPRKKKKDVSEEITQVKKFHINGTFGDISQYECTKDKMLEADPNLGRRVTIHMDIQKIHSPRYRKSHNRRTPAVFKTTLNIFQTKK